jgi:hypothetical protein
MIDKRTFPRLSRDWDIEYQMSNAESIQPIQIKGGIRDLSGGGFSFKSESVCPPATLLQFTIMPTDSFNPVVGVARIAWTRAREGFYENGAQFVWVRWKAMETQTAIANYVLDNMSKRPS